MTSKLFYSRDSSFSFRTRFTKLVFFFSFNNKNRLKLVKFIIKEESPLDPVLGDDGNPAASTGASITVDCQRNASRSKKIVSLDQTFG